MATFGEWLCVAGETSTPPPVEDLKNRSYCALLADSSVSLLCSWGPQTSVVTAVAVAPSRASLPNTSNCHPLPQ